MSRESELLRPPSGEWGGYYLYPGHSQKHPMRLQLQFAADGALRGDGHDYVGAFVLAGGYDLSSGRCWWTKHYVGQHDVLYQGQLAGDTIEGRWEIPPLSSGTFRVWPAWLGEAAEA